MRRSLACLVTLLSLAGCTEKVTVNGKEYVLHGRPNTPALVPQYLTAPEDSAAEETAEARHALAEPMIHHLPYCEEQLFSSSAPVLPKVNLDNESSSENDFWTGGWTGGNGLPYGTLPRCE
jgi:hypothetical protein